jgi:hypothetical protein
VDAHVVVCAERDRQVVAISDGGDLRRIATGLQLVAV